MIVLVKPTNNSFNVTYENGDVLSVPNAEGNRHYQEIQTWLSEGNNLEPEFTLEELKENKRSEIRSAFDIESVQPVTVEGVEYHGGYDSNQKLDAGVRLAEQNNQTNITFFDTSNVGHNLLIADAKDVTTGIGVKYQNDFSKKQGLMVNIDDASDESTVNNINW